jgi:hypothetical protein
MIFQHIRSHQTNIHKAQAGDLWEEILKIASYTRVLMRSYNSDVTLAVYSRELLFQSGQNSPADSRVTHGGIRVQEQYSV